MPSTTPLASFKDLCIDAVDPVLIGRFWAATLDRTMTQRDDGLVILDGATPRDRIWINAVPEPVTAKQRVHLDVRAVSHRDVLRHGATPLDTTSYAWQVLRDPEGGELCVFERDAVSAERLYEIVVDCADPRSLAEWWSGVLGGRVEHDDEHGWSSVDDVPGAPFDHLVMVPVPEPKRVKNRIHWDVDLAAGATLESLTAYGASVVGAPGNGTAWTVLADPEGNEFCVFPG